MNTKAPITEVMSTGIITVGPDTQLCKVKDLFLRKNIHHIPVTNHRKLLGMISKTDLLHHIRGPIECRNRGGMDNKDLLENYCAKDIMTERVGKLKSRDKIGDAVEVFRENFFRAIPVVDDDKLVGMVTPIDLINFSVKSSTRAPQVAH